MQAPWTPEALGDLFSYHAPVGDQVNRYELVRALARQFAEAVCELTPASAEQTLAIRSIHLAMMHANSAIAVNEPAP